MWSLELPAAARDSYALATPDEKSARRVDTPAGGVVTWFDAPSDNIVVTGELPAILGWLISVTDDELALQVWQDAIIDERIFIA